MSPLCYRYRTTTTTTTTNETFTSLGLHRRSAIALARGHSLGVRFTEFTNSLQIQVSPENLKNIKFFYYQVTVGPSLVRKENFVSNAQMEFPILQERGFAMLDKLLTPNDKRLLCLASIEVEWLGQVVFRPVGAVPDVVQVPKVSAQSIWCSCSTF